MEKFLRWCKGYIFCYLFNGDIERFFNLCKNQGIEIWNIHWIDQGFTCFMYAKDFLKMRYLIKRAKVKIRIQKKFGLYFFLHQLKRRKGFLVGLLISCITLCLLSSRIWRIETFGNSYYTKEAIIKYLKENESFYPGINKTKINTSRLDENLRIFFEDISWISTYIEGTSLIFEIKESNFEEKKESTVQSKDIVSNIKGKIVGMVTRSGSPCVTVGDSVDVGDVLIRSKINIYDENKNITEERIVGADGDVWIQTLYNYNKIYIYGNESVLLGYPKYGIQVRVGDLHFLFGTKKNDNDNKQNYLNTTHYLNLTQNTIIALEIYRPFEIIASLESISEAKEEARKELSDLFCEFKEKGVQIIENNVRMIVYGDRVEATGSLVIVQPVTSSKTNIPREIIENGETYEYNGNDN